MSLGRILVVDDDATTRLVLREYLTELGHTVSMAEDGEDAMRKFEPGGFDCVVSDLFMPKVDGLELLKRIRMKDKGVLFLLITAYPSIDGAVNAIREGAFDYVTKPFHMEDFRVKVERALKTKKTVGSLKTRTGILWGMILLIPVWLILGFLIGKAWG